jgi:hypothetical protein
MASEPNSTPDRATGTQTFKIDRWQRIHHDGAVVRVYQIVGATEYGWDSNREVPVPDRPLHASLEAAQQAADEGVLHAGHVCDDRRYNWKSLS